MNKESMKIGRYIDGRMHGGEKLAFDRELSSDPFLAEAVDGFRSDPEALFDLPVYKTTMHVWWAVAGLGTVLFVFLFLSQWVDNTPISETKIKTSSKASIMVNEKPQPAKSKTEDISIRFQEAKIPEQASKSTVSESKAVFVELETMPIRKTESIKKHVAPAKINRFSEGTYIIGLKVAKPIEKQTQEWRFKYGNQEKHIPAQFENEESLHFNKVIVPRYFKVENPTYTEVLAEALAAFKKDKFSACLMELKKIEEEHPGDLNVLFYSGLSNYHLGEYAKAISCFSQTSAAANAVFVPEAKWYLALSLWKSGKKSEAGELFSEISAEGGFYAERAAKMDRALTE